MTNFKVKTSRTAKSEERNILSKESAKWSMAAARLNENLNARRVTRVVALGNIFAWPGGKCLKQQKFIGYKVIG